MKFIYPLICLTAISCSPVSEKYQLPPASELGSKDAKLRSEQYQYAEQIYQAATTVKAIQPVTSQSKKAISLDEAYEIQSILDSMMSQKYGHVTGHKMAYTSAASQKTWNIDAPVSGTFFKKQFVKSGGSVEADSFIGFHIESEIAFVLSQDITQPITSVEDAENYIKSVHVGLDVPDLRFDRSEHPLQLADVVAMSCGTHTYLIGKGVPPQGLDYANMQVSLDRNGEEVYSGTASNVLGDPRKALVMLANQQLEKGNYLRKNQVILSGSVASAYFPKDREGRLGSYIGKATGLPSVELNVK
ncbi:2-keto-4-pentenoate hydratase [Persicirhabdus sediminis]|uniref:Fumarylacetoacetate hydrolase family protein n=1 Tax=Persicirhabdus sediminis TaxID=454144 RepID=A0A8J7SHM3_9BACT|nr:fumarylacetoacetate hydrolase family protein [Persicirhabdus sediminis]MBK1789944.1 fumarylacetoacetate hydrolase family protein [Persicirhabdus sediminis]